MRHCDGLIWTIVYVIFSSTLLCTNGCAEEKQGDKNDVPGRKIKQKEADITYGKLVASLEYRNPEPKIVGKVPEQQALFAKEYDWKEQDRVLKTIQRLVDDVEAAWPALIDHLDDEAYCITFAYEQSVSNHSIGDVCYMILLESLTAAYMPHIPPDDTAFRRLGCPKVIPWDNSKFKSWCRERYIQGGSLRELQVEMCQWVLEELPKLELLDVTEAECRESAQKIQKEIERLRTTKKPATVKTIIHREIMTCYSQKRADAIRATFQEEKGGEQNPHNSD